MGETPIIGSCGDDSINYREKLIGEWELKNVGELQSFFRNKSFAIKGASMKFEDSGLIETRMNRVSTPSTAAFATFIYPAANARPHDGGIITQLIHCTSCYA